MDIDRVTRLESQAWKLITKIENLTQTTRAELNKLQQQLAKVREQITVANQTNK